MELDKLPNGDRLDFLKSFLWKCGRPVIQIFSEIREDEGFELVTISIAEILGEEAQDTVLNDSNIVDGQHVLGFHTEEIKELRSLVLSLEDGVQNLVAGVERISLFILLPGFSPDFIKLLEKAERVGEDFLEHAWVALGFPLNLLFEPLEIGRGSVRRDSKFSSDFTGPLPFQVEIESLVSSLGEAEPGVALSFSHIQSLSKIVQESKRSFASSILNPLESVEVIGAISTMYRTELRRVIARKFGLALTLTTDPVSRVELNPSGDGGEWISEDGATLHRRNLLPTVKHLAHNESKEEFLADIEWTLTGRWKRGRKVIRYKIVNVAPGKIRDQIWEVLMAEGEVRFGLWDDEFFEIDEPPSYTRDRSESPMGEDYERMTG